MQIRFPQENTETAKALLDRCMKLGLIDSRMDKRIGVAAVGGSVYTMYLTNGKTATVENMKGALLDYSASKTETVWYPEVTPDAICEEMWATWAALNANSILYNSYTGSGEESSKVTEFLKETCNIFASALTGATPVLMDTSTLRENTFAMNPQKCHDKWHNKKIPIALYNNLINQNPLYIVFNENVKGKDYLAALQRKVKLNPAYQMKQYLEGGYISSFIVIPSKTIQQDYEKYSLKQGLIGGMLMVHPSFDKPYITFMPLLDEKENIGLISWCIILEALEFAFSTKAHVEHRLPSDETVFQSSNRLKKKNLFIPEVHVIKLRRIEVEKDNARSSNETEVTREHHYQEFVPSHPRRLKDGRVIQVKSFKRYENLPPRPGTTVYMVNR